MKLKRALGLEELFATIAIVLLLFTPLIGGYWWWPLIVVGVIIILALVRVLRRTPRRIDRYMVT
jgi:hypothetical protein